MEYRMRWPAIGICLVLLLSLFMVADPSSIMAAPATPSGVLTVCSSGCDYSGVQGAVDAAGPGDTIKVAQGTYGITIGDDQVVDVSKNVTIRGGYQKPNWDQPNPLQNVTTINAYGYGRGIYVHGAVSVTIDGFHITGGDATGLGGGDPSGDAGGGLYVDSSGGGSVRLLNNVVFSNTAGSTGLGGGLYINDGTALLFDNQVMQNTALSGGGLYVVQSALTMERNFIQDNAATDGAGIYLFYRTVASIVNQVIADNQTQSDHGSEVHVIGSSLNLIHATIASSEPDGGNVGVHVNDSLGNAGNLTCTNTIIANQDTGVSVDSGGTATLYNTLWTSNTTDWIGPGTITHTDDVWGGAAFVDPSNGDYHIEVPSAAREAARDAGVADDIDGDPRPQGLEPDIGADELVNQPPVADAGSDQTVSTGAMTTLDGSGSSDLEDNLPLAYAWTQTGGPPVTLNGAMTVTAVFTAPMDPAVLTFTLMVTDSLGLPDVTPDAVVVTVTNQAPVADAGSNRMACSTCSVTLDGSGSSDADGDLPLTYAWTQTGGPSVTLEGASAVTATFTAPGTSSTPVVLTFSLVVTDSLGLADTTADTVTITVEPRALYLPMAIRQN